MPASHQVSAPRSDKKRFNSSRACGIGVLNDDLALVLMRIKPSSEMGQTATLLPLIHSKAR